MGLSHADLHAYRLFSGCRQGQGRVLMLILVLGSLGAWPPQVSGEDKICSQKIKMQ